jgi:hypothetical protein
MKHLKTNKHKLTDGKVCDVCGKAFKTRQSLWKHKKDCVDTNKLLLQLIQQNNDLQKQIQNVHVQNVQNIQVNQNFNLNIFLNETCKDALNIDEFVESLKVHECDIVETGQIGFVNGISKIFIRGLEELELNRSSMAKLSKESLRAPHQNNNHDSKEQCVIPNWRYQ